MILTYSKPIFKTFIMQNIKLHSLREDGRNRWKQGRKIQHWLYSPRHPQKQPHQFLENTCTAVENIIIVREGMNGIAVQVDSKRLDYFEICTLAMNDGLSYDQFRMWFVPPSLPVWKGKIIHWTDKRYATF